MTRAVLKCAFAALLALLSAQAVVPSVRVAASIEIVRGASLECKTKKQIPLEQPGIQTDASARQETPEYVSRIRPEPDATALFQRPPPRSSLFS
jgi:hypothetical protein